MSWGLFNLFKTFKFGKFPHFSPSIVILGPTKLVTWKSWTWKWSCHGCHRIASFSILACDALNPCKGWLVYSQGWRRRTMIPNIHSQSCVTFCVWVLRAFLFSLKGFHVGITMHFLMSLNYNPTTLLGYGISQMTFCWSSCKNVGHDIINMIASNRHCLPWKFCRFVT